MPILDDINSERDSNNLNMISLEVNGNCQFSRILRLCNPVLIGCLKTCCLKGPTKCTYFYPVGQGVFSNLYDF